jgi:protein TonB
MLPLALSVFALLATQAASPAPPEESGRAQRARLVQASITIDDYPAAAAREGAEGTVLTRFVVDRSGQPTNCVIAQSSGNAALDEVSCRIVIERFRFEPARNAAGRRIEETHQQRFVWQLPDPIPPPEPASQD